MSEIADNTGEKDLAADAPTDMTARPAPARSSHEDIEDMPLVDKVGRLGGLLHRYTKSQAEAHGRFGDPLHGQGRLLTLLKAKPKTSQRELSFLLDMRQQSLSELLSKLEEKGFITREKSAEDGRVMMVKLTEAGAAAAPDLDAISSNEDVFDCLTPEERTAFEQAIIKVSKSLEAKLQERGIDTTSRPAQERRSFHGSRGGRDGRDGRDGREDRGRRYRGRDERGGRGGRDGRDGRGGYRKGYRDGADGSRDSFRAGGERRGYKSTSKPGFEREDSRHGYRHSGRYQSRKRTSE
ncbi:MAG: MarR family winged helix-turn-helix transcriptional regulator [Atopobiaceae bacterium]|jgi:DNA-binding MarR family transcriptional regulator